MAKRKKTGLTKHGFPVSPGFNFQNEVNKLDRQERLEDLKKRREGPSIGPRRAPRVG